MRNRKGEMKPWNPKWRRERAIHTHSWLIYRVPPVWEMTQLPLTQLLAIQPTQGHLCNICGSCHRTATPLPHPASSRRKPCDPAACPPLRSFPTRPDPVSVVLVIRTWFWGPNQETVLRWFCGKTTKPRVLGPASRKAPWLDRHRAPARSSMTSSCSSRHHVART
jgi:hypothetical protein